MNELVNKRKIKLKLNLPSNAAPFRILNTIEKEKFVIDAWISSIPNQPFLMVNWDELIEDSTNQLNIIGEFINLQLDVEKSKNVISSHF